MIPSRADSQVRSHAQKFIAKLFSKNKMRYNPNLKIIKYMKLAENSSSLSLVFSDVGEREEQHIEQALLNNLIEQIKLRKDKGVEKSKVSKAKRLFKIKKIDLVAMSERATGELSSGFVDALSHKRNYNIFCASPERDSKFEDNFNEWKDKLLIKKTAK